MTTNHDSSRCTKLQVTAFSHARAGSWAFYGSEGRGFESFRARLASAQVSWPPLVALLGLAGEVTRLGRLAYPSYEKLHDGRFPETLARRPRFVTRESKATATASKTGTWAASPTTTSPDTHSGVNFGRC
jgi:hypothetical protein